MKKGQRKQRSRTHDASAGETGAPAASAPADRRDPPPRPAGAPTPKAGPPDAAAGLADIFQTEPPEAFGERWRGFVTRVGVRAEPDGRGATGQGTGTDQPDIGELYADAWRRGPEPRPSQGRGVEGLVAERETTHGDFVKMAFAVQAIKAVLRTTPNWPYLTDGQTTALEEIAVKVARILCGDPDHPDHWNDIGGYADRGRSAARRRRD